MIQDKKFAFYFNNAGAQQFVTLGKWETYLQAAGQTPQVFNVLPNLDPTPVFD